MRTYSRVTLFTIIATMMGTILTFLVPIYAQGTNNGVVVQHPIQGENIQTGMIVSGKNNAYSLSVSENDSHMYGVIVSNPAITLGKKTDTNAFPVANIGTVPVLVSSDNGIVRKGDYITSSKNAGIGTKLIKPGYTIGIALDDAPQTDSKAPVLVLATVLPQQVSAEMIATPKQNSEEQVKEELKETDESSRIRTFIEYVKIITSGLVVLTACIGGVLYYIQLSKIEVEALGRNPLASQSIHHTMVKHAMVVVVICSGGLIIGFVILRI